MALINGWSELRIQANGRVVLAVAKESTSSNYLIPALSRSIYICRAGTGKLANLGGASVMPEFGMESPSDVANDSQWGIPKDQQALLAGELHRVGIEDSNAILAINVTGGTSIDFWVRWK